MTEERWQRIKALFQAASESAPNKRAAFLDEACGSDLSLRQEVAALLASDERAGRFLENPAVADGAPILLENVDASLVGRSIGPYKTLREIGHGGMGMVYLAARADDQFQKQVAIKLIKRGLDTNAILRRFRHEQQMLAQLDHPNIARLIDAGTTADGLPYFIMEYVEGLPIDLYCDQYQLPTTERLQLFRTVCSAVHYAHRYGIVHRDIKPGNILVTAEGVPKLLDFGIAKLLHPERTAQAVESTGAGVRPMTPKYASPEQVRGSAITPASDIYALGVLLYELLTGHHPYGIQTPAAHEIEQLICDEEPVKPSTVIGRIEEVPSRDGATRVMLTPESVSKTREKSFETLRRRLAGDLDTIMLMALHKEPERRYPSAAEFSEDISRHLKGLPVIARKDTLAYRSIKFVRRNKASMPAAAMIIALLLALTGVGIYRFPRGSQVINNPMASLAVLPLESLSSDPEQEYFADGMTDALINNLAQIGALRVISWTSVMAYKGTRKPLPEIAQALHVDSVVEGSVLRSGNRVRISVQLIQAATDRHLWAQTYERDLQDILTLQSEVARAVSQEIKITLSPEEQTRLASARPVQREAYDAYLKGRYFWHKAAGEGMEKSLAYFQQAIEKDPSYALAYAGLADAYLRLQSFSTLPPRELLPKAEASAMKAVALDGTLAEAHTALAEVKLRSWDWSGAERESKRALELNPSYAHARFNYGYLLADMGRHEAAIAELKRARDLDPLSLPIHRSLAAVFYYGGQYDQAIKQTQQAIEMNPTSMFAHRMLGLVYEQKGMYDEAIREFQKAVALPEGHLAIGTLGHAYAVAGKRKEAEKVISDLKELSQHRYVSPYFIAEVYTGLGEKDRAFEWLDRAYEERAQWLVLLKADPRFHGLRSDPRFADLLRRVGLPP